MELNRKLAWAEAIGFPPPTIISPSSPSCTTQQAKREDLKWKRLAQAAKGVSLFPTNTSGGEIKETTADDGLTDIQDNEKMTSSLSSSILRCGTFLIAHPLMTGYFAKSVIVLLDHAEEEVEEVGNSTKATEEGEGDGSSSGGGGTYGLIINRLALQPETAESSYRRRLHQWEMLRQRREEEQEKSQSEEENEKTTLTSDSASLSLRATTSSAITDTHQNVLKSISLLQAINADDLPETVQSAFGDAPVREGGPVNLSLQMIHRKSVYDVATKEETDKTSEENIKQEEDGTVKKVIGYASDIGGTILGYDDDRSKRDAEDTIYFGGDVIKASYAVLGGESDRDDFSFIIGASCWSPGQLQHEIERGCWLPFRGPASLALTGMCEHNEVAIDSERAPDKGTTKLSLFPPRPSNPPTGALQEQAGGHAAIRRPVGDLWLSVMCALGEGEAELAYMMLDQNNVLHPLGDACDNFDR